MSLDRSWRLRILDIIECAEKVEAYTRGLDLASFASNGMVIDATVRNLEIMGEAARHVPPEVQARCPDVEWQLMNDMRNFLVHSYKRVNLGIDWDAVTRDVPRARDRLVRLLEDEGAEER